ncbi:hypothetical protein EDD85DRAFT_938762 [Armillaria nabsnona]|nr:hypothetical protein EDD85DRAFT_938762 [Armillaria nabsnona]
MSSLSVSVSLAGHISPLTLTIDISEPWHTVTLEKFVEKVDKNHGLWCSCTEFIPSASSLYQTCRPINLSTYQALKSFVPDASLDKKINDNGALHHQQWPEHGPVAFIIGAYRSPVPESAPTSSKRRLEEQPENPRPVQILTGEMKVIEFGECRIVLVKDPRYPRSIKCKPPADFRRLLFEPGTFTFDRSNTMLSIGQTSVEHSRHLVLEVSLQHVAVFSLKDFKDTFDRAVKISLKNFLEKYQDLLQVDVSQGPTLLNDDLEQSFERIMKLAEKGGIPVLLVATDYDLAANFAWYNRICKEQGITPFQVSLYAPPRLFSWVNTWFNNNVIDMVICVGEYGCFTGAIRDKLPLYDLSFEPEFNRASSVTKLEALSMLRVLYKDVATRKIDWDHDRFKEFVTFAGEYLYSPDASESVLRHRWSYYFLSQVQQHQADKDYSFKSLLVPGVFMSYPTIIQRTTRIITENCSKKIKQKIFNMLWFRDSETVLDIILTDTKLTYDHVHTLPLLSTTFATPRAPDDDALPKLLLALGFFTLDPKTRLRIRVPNRTMAREGMSMLHHSLVDNVKPFSGADWIRSNVEKAVRALGVNYIQDTREQTLQMLMIMLIDRGSPPYKTVLEEFHSKEKLGGSGNEHKHRRVDLFIPGTHDVIELKNAPLLDIYRETFGPGLSPTYDQLRALRTQIRNMNIRPKDLDIPEPKPASFYDKADRGIPTPYTYKPLNAKLKWHDLRVAYRYQSTPGRGPYYEGIKHLDHLWRDGRYQALLYQNIIAQGDNIARTAHPGFVSDFRVRSHRLESGVHTVKAFVVILIAAEVVFVDELGRYSGITSGNIILIVLAHEFENGEPEAYVGLRIPFEENAG